MQGGSPLQAICFRARAERLLALGNLSGKPQGISTILGFRVACEDKMGEAKSARPCDMIELKQTHLGSARGAFLSSQLLNQRKAVQPAWPPWSVLQLLITCFAKQQLA